MENTEKLDNLQSNEIGKLFEAICFSNKYSNNFQLSNSCSKFGKYINKRFVSNQNDNKSDFDRFFEKICFGFSDCWFWYGCIDTSGYGRTNLLHENFAHRASWILFNGFIPKDKKILHKCDIRNCVNPDHLFIGSQKDNVQDMISKGRSVSPKIKYGEKNPMHKLSTNIVKEIREYFSNNKISYSQLAKKYNVSSMTIHRIITLKTWINI